MNEVWLSIKSWTQRLLLAALVLYAALYIYNNTYEVKFWFWFKHEHETTVFLLTSGAFLAGVIFTILLSTALKTIRQVKDLHSRGRQEKLERDITEMKAKAAMLQTRPLTEEPKNS